MAEVILSPLLDLIFRSLASAAMQELQLVWGVDEELHNLKSTLSVIHAVLEDAEERQFHSKAVQDWLHKLKYVAYDAEDLVDEIATEAQQSVAAGTGTEAGDKTKKKRQVLNIVSSCFNCSQIPYKQREMAIRIREINTQLDKIAKERSDLHLETRDESKQLRVVIRERPRTVSSVRDELSEVLGRLDDIEQITDYLLSEDSRRRKFSIIGITGMGGVGKTTLAQVVYNDKRVIDNFELRAWICVSEHFDVERLTKEIISSTSKSACDLSDIDSLQCCLRDKLKGKKFLLVLDDAWNENCSDWERLQAPFTFGARGSKIVVTTRSQAVMDAMQAASVHNLKCLSIQDCLSLFVNQAFDDDNADAYPELIKIGEELVNKCGGLPLAAKALGRLLSSKRQVSEWENILKSPIWNLRGPASNILPALRLSYQHLPAHLKRCFTFLSVFPKDYEFRKDELVQMWVAHGFICPEEGKPIEDTASECFNDLLLRSFFQVSSFAGCTTYKMHDVIHDLAQFISGDEYFQMEHGKSHGVPRKTMHLCYTIGEREEITFESFYELKGVRTLLLVNAFNIIVDEKVTHEMFERFRFIRVLDLNLANITKLPNAIGNLKYLRYLNLSASNVKELPESICSIYNMQTLVLRYCRNLVELPNEMRQLINLRHLDIEGCEKIAFMPTQMGRLTCLQTLSRFVVGRKREGGIAELKELTGIRGELRIGKLENVAEAEDARQANLEKKPSIHSLQLMWSGNRNDGSFQGECLEREIADELQPHPNLKSLEFYNYMGAGFPSWMMKMDTLMLLSNLMNFDLRKCRRCSILPPLGCLPSLCELKISRMYEVKQMGGRELCGMAGGGFPSLKILSLESMPNLEQWQEHERGDFPCLQNLVIKNCPQLRKMPYSNPFPNLKFLWINGCASLVSLPRLPSLKELYLDNLVNLEEWCDVSVGEAHFPHLQGLYISQCPKMMRWPNILPAIVELTIFECQGFTQLPPLLPCLHNLVMRGCGEKLLKSVPNLTSLSSLDICGISSLTSLPRGMLQSLTQLKDLRILDCEELVTLPAEENEDLPSTLTSLLFSNCINLKSLPRGLHALTSLHTLEIRNCPRLTSLRDEGLTSSLQRLRIYGCPMLEERCRKDGGEDWPKISNVPHVCIL